MFEQKFSEKKSLGRKFAGNFRKPFQLQDTYWLAKKFWREMNIYH